MENKDLSQAGSDEGFIVSNVDCGSCPNITDGCRGICEKIQLDVPRISVNWHMQEFYESKFGAHVRAEDYYAAQSELSALREENERLKSESFEELYNAAIDERDALREELANAMEDIDTIADHNIDLQQRLTAAEQRNAELVELLTEAMPHLNTAASAFKAVKPIRDKVRDALKPTESGASE